MATYRGKYPKRIKSVSIGTPYGGALCVTNDGMRYVVKPANEHGAANAPQVNQDIRAIAASADYTIENAF